MTPKNRLLMLLTVTILFWGNHCWTSSPPGGSSANKVTPNNSRATNRTLNIGDQPPRNSRPPEISSATPTTILGPNLAVHHPIGIPRIRFPHSAIEPRIPCCDGDSEKSSVIAGSKMPTLKTATNPNRPHVIHSNMTNQAYGEPRSGSSAVLPHAVIRNRKITRWLSLRPYRNSATRFQKPCGSRECSHVVNAQEGIRTPTPLREADFKSAASAIPPPGHAGSPRDMVSAFSSNSGNNRISVSELVGRILRNESENVPCVRLVTITPFIV